jgi:SH3-like domain-containing protein
VRSAVFVLCLLLLGLSGCKDSGGSKQESAYVAAPEAVLRDRVAAVYNKTGTVHNGEKVVILERMQNRRFVRVRSPRGEEGWVQERYLTDQLTFDQFQHLAEQFKNVPAQAVAMTRSQVNLHVAPGRKTEHLYQLNENEKVDLLQRQAADKNAPAPQPVQTQAQSKGDKGEKKDADTEPATGEEQEPRKPDQAPILEDWWLVRDSQKRVGWVLGRLLYVDVPIEVGQYAEGQRIVAFYVLDQVQDDDKKVPEYLVLLTENKDGMPYDYDQVRVFTWNVRKHRYETAYRERDLLGFLPVALGTQNFEKEGNLRTFTLRAADGSGNVHERKYKFNPPIVRAVLAPGEQPLPKVHHKPALARRRHT